MTIRSPVLTELGDIFFLYNHKWNLQGFLVFYCAHLDEVLVS